jgi:protein involved in polysaccharide export with SLBB domain
MTLSDLIAKADSLTPDAYMNRGTITRTKADMTTVNIPFDVSEVMNGKQIFELSPLDRISIQSHFDMEESQYFAVSGEVLRPGIFAFSDNISLSDAIFIAGGFTQGADSTYIEVARKLKSSESAKISDR